MKIQYPHLLCAASWLAGLVCIVAGYPQWAWPFTFVAGFALSLTSVTSQDGKST